MQHAARVDVVEAAEAEQPHIEDGADHKPHVHVDFGALDAWPAVQG